MDKISHTTPDLTQENLERLTELFPQVATEIEDENGVVKPSIDFDALRDLLGDVAEGQRERYQFTWPGKAEAKLEARKPCDKTLRPHPEKSVDWDATQNVYIEGDNLDALKVMRETYAGKVKLIYIDPPYNTGHDFIYDDDFAQTHEEYDAQSGEYDEEGGRLVANLESNGRFHSDWCSMMYPRLLLARDLLSSDGAIFISIDDREQKNLRAICDEVFGAGQFKSDISWQKRYTRSNNTVDFTTVVEHLLVYAKGDAFEVNLLPRTGEADDRYTNPDNDSRGPWKGKSFLNPATPAQRPNLCYSITNPNNGHITNPTNHAWRVSQIEYERLEADGLLYWGADGQAEVPSIKMFLSEARGLTPINLWTHEYAGNTDMGGNETKNLFGEKYFDFPKPTLLLRRVLEHGSCSDSLVLDFFSGSGSMADAVIQQNAIDDGNRRFIMVQLPEKTSEQSVAYRDGYKTICDIGEERIRRAGKKIVEEVEAANAQLKLGEDPKPVPDIGFRVFSIDSSNFLDTYSEPGEQTQASLLSLVDNLKEDRTPEDLLFQVLPAFRIPYSAHVEKMDIASAVCFNVNDGQLIACFDTEVSTAVIEKIAQLKPIYAVFRDASFASDSDAANFEELFKTYSPDTVRRVI